MLSEVVLCVVLTCCYLLLLAVSLVQLLRIVSAQHDYYSFQCGFLLLAVLWSAARAFFFGEWFGLPELLSLLLWWLPFDLQFSTFSLLLLFYASLLHHTRWHHGSHQRMAYATVLAVVNVMAPILTTAWAVTSVLQSRAIVTLESVHHAYNACQLFALFAVFLYHGIRLHSSQSSAGHVVMLSSLLRPLFPLSVLTTVCLIVFLSRAIFAVLNSVGLYDIEIGGDQGGWKMVSPVAFVVLLLWEVLPTAAVLLFFRHIPSHSRRKWKWQWAAGGCCGGDDECATSGGAGGRAATRERSDRDGESERSSSPHSASSRLSYNTADELEADLLHSAGSLSSHSFSSASPMPLSPALQQSTQHTALYTQPALPPSSSSPSALLLSYQPPLLSAAHSTYLPPPQLSVQSIARSSLSSPSAAALHVPFSAALSSSFSPPQFASPVVLSPSLSASPSPAAASVTDVLSSPGDARAGLYSRAAERWRVRRDGGHTAADGNAVTATAAHPVAVASAPGTVRSTAADDDDEYEYRASLDHDT